MTNSPPPLAPGTLYLVATPIGNLEDITLRALRTLKECDVIAAEDTRHTGQMLKHFGISRPLLSYFQFNEARRSEEIIERLKRGEKIALVTDAGSPGISDPGERVVRAASAVKADLPLKVDKADSMGRGAKAGKAVRVEVTFKADRA